MTLIVKTTRWLVLTALLSWTVHAGAALTIEITRGVESALPIAIVPFGWESPLPKAPQNVSDIVAADLARTGRFNPLPERDMLAKPQEGSQINFTNWRILGSQNLVVGRIRDLGAGRLEVRFQLFDVFKAKQLIGYSIPTTTDGLRLTAHRISDLIYEELTGEPGAFTTRIAYVVASRTADSLQYALQIADVDGYGPQTVLTSPEPIMSPSWSPDGKRLAYVSFENRRSEIYLQVVDTGQREKIASFSGINGAPSWSPDGRRLALTLSRSGSPDIYVMDLASKRLTQITRNFAIDTEPTWAPDGRTIYFTSDRGGKPQIYAADLNGGRAKRVTFEGEYNSRPMLSPDGKKLAMVHGENGVYTIAVQELQTGILQVLTDGNLDESPSFAPNGSMIIYAEKGRTQGSLAAVSVDGRVRQSLQSQEGDVREPAWSPYPANSQ